MLHRAIKGRIKELDGRRRDYDILTEKEDEKIVDGVADGFGPQHSLGGAVKEQRGDVV